MSTTVTGRGPATTHHDRVLRFEPLDLSHGDEAFALWSDLETVKFTNWTHTPTRELCAERLAKVVAYYGKEPRHFGPYVLRLADGAFVGMIGADLRDESLGAYEVWYALRRDVWGRGVATQALGELLGRMKAAGRVKRAVATAVTVNEASWRLLEKLGFTREGVVPEGHQKHDLRLDLFSYGRALEPSGPSAPP